MRDIRRTIFIESSLQLEIRDDHSKSGFELNRGVVFPTRDEPTFNRDNYSNCDAVFWITKYL